MKRSKSILIATLPVLLVVVLACLPASQINGSLLAMAGKISLIFAGAGLAALITKRYHLGAGFLLAFGLLLVFAFGDWAQPQTVNSFRLAQFTHPADAQEDEISLPPMANVPDLLAVFHGPDQSALRLVGENAAAFSSKRTCRLNADSSVTLFARHPIPETSGQDNLLRCRIAPPAGQVELAISAAGTVTPDVDILLLAPGDTILRSAQHLQAQGLQASHRDVRKTWWNPFQSGLVNVYHSPKIRMVGESETGAPDGGNGIIYINEFDLQAATI